MKILITTEELDKLKSRDLVPFECEICHATFHKKKHYALRGIKGTRNYSSCSKECWKLVISKRHSHGNILLKCEQCGKEFSRSNKIHKKCNLKTNKVAVCGRRCAAIWQHKNGLFTPPKLKSPIELICNWCGNKFNRNYRIYKRSQIKHQKLPFCCRSHASQWNQKFNPPPINIRSKLELWIEGRLKVDFPDLEIIYNDRHTINGEIDIWIPMLDLGFELNGIYHYEPIYGDNNLFVRQKKDREKSNECKSKKIELHILDCRKVSGKQLPNEFFYNIILEKIDERSEYLSSNLSNKMEHEPNIALTELTLERARFSP